MKEAGKEKRGERGRKQAKTPFKISIFAHFVEGGLSHLCQGGNLTRRGEVPGRRKSETPKAAEKNHHCPRVQKADLEM